MAHRIFIRGYQREGEWVDGYWRRMDDLAKAVKKLNTTERAAVQLPDGIEITKASQTMGGGYIITGGEHNAPEHVNTYNAHEAARTALQRSARSTNPRSLGGAKRFQTHVQAAKHDRARLRREGGTERTTKRRSTGTDAPPAGPVTVAKYPSGDFRLKKNGKAFGPRYKTQEAAQARANQLNQTPPRNPGGLSDEAYLRELKAKLKTVKGPSRAQSLDRQIRELEARISARTGPKPSPPGKPTPDPDPPPTPPGGTSQDELAKAKRKFRKLRRESTKLEEMLGRETLSGSQRTTIEKKLSLKRNQLETQERIVKNLEETGGKPEPRNSPGGRKRSTREPAAPKSTTTLSDRETGFLKDAFDGDPYKPESNEQRLIYESLKSKLEVAAAKPGQGRVRLRLTVDEQVELTRVVQAEESGRRIQLSAGTGDTGRVASRVVTLMDLGKRLQRRLPRGGGGNIDPLVRTELPDDKQSLVKDSLRQLMGVHSLPPGVHRVDIGKIDPREYPTYHGVYLGFNKIQIRDYAGPLTLWHEVGHWLDYTKIIPGRALWQKSASEAGKRDHPPKSMKKLMDTIEATDGIQTIRRRAYGPSGRGRPSKHQRYLLSKREQFARAYAQYIATKSQNSRALQEVERRSASLFGADHWKHDDFQPVVEAFDELMRELGWIQ